MIKTCGICRGPHFTAECPNQQHISHGDTRIVTDPSILHRQVADVPRPPLVPPDRPKLVTNPVTSSVTLPVTVTSAVTAAQECQDCIRYRNKIAALEAELKAEQTKTRTKPKPLSAAERVRRHRQRKAAKVRPTPKHP